jgi:hypothetical protein
MKKIIFYALFENFLLSPAYCLLFSAYPVMTLFANNLFQVDDWAFARPLLAFLGLAAVLALFFYFLVKSWQQAAILVTIFLVFFMAYGHIANLVL